MGALEDLKEDFLDDRDEEYFVLFNEDVVYDYSDLVNISEKEVPKTLTSDVVKMLEISYRLCKNKLLVMLDKSTYLSFGDNDSYTEGTYVKVATKYFDDNSMSTVTKVDLVQGLTIHEACHILYTDFDMWKEAIGKKMSMMFKNIFNIVEDEMIERRLSDDFPGYSKYLAPVKYFYFEVFYHETYKAPKGNLDELFSQFFNLVRYPTNLEEALCDKHEVHLLNIKKALTPYPTNTEESLKASETIYDIIKEFITEDDTIKSEELSEELSSTVSEISKHGSELDDSCKSSSVSKMEEEDSERHEEVENISIFDCRKDIRRYGALRVNTSHLSANLSRVLRWELDNKRGVIRRQKRGNLDGGLLAEAVQGTPNVYSKKYNSFYTAVDIILLVDLSGSMAGKKIDVARELTVMINEAIDRVPNMNLYIYGHTADRGSEASTDITVFREGNIVNKEAMGGMEDDSNNRDGDAILYCAKRVRRLTENKILYLVISDGAPSAYGYYDGITDTKNKVIQVEKMGMEVVHVAIESSVPSKSMFKNYVTYSDLSTTVKDMSNLVKKLIPKLSTNVKTIR